MGTAHQRVRFDRAEKLETEMLKNTQGSPDHHSVESQSSLVDKRALRLGHRVEVRSDGASRAHADRLATNRAHEGVQQPKG